jgi:hypothetical protein
MMDKYEEEFLTTTDTKNTKGRGINYFFVIFSRFAFPSWTLVFLGG